MDARDNADRYYDANIMSFMLMIMIMLMIIFMLMIVINVAAGNCNDYVGAWVDENEWYEILADAHFR